MLKKVLAFLLALALCLSLGACKKNDVQQPGNDDSSESIVNSGSSESNDNSESTDNSESVNNSESTDNSETTENSESTGNTENAGSSKNTETLNQLSVADWQPDAPAYLSYEEYFNVSRVFGGINNRWIKADKKFSLEKSQDGWYVSCNGTDQRYTIPNSKGYTDYTLLGSDGRYGYMYYEACLIRMDLVTGEPERLIHYPIYDAVRFWLCDNLVLYYFVYVNNELQIGRIYLPELKYDTLYQEQGEFYNTYLQKPNTNLDTLVWTLVNPEFITFLKGEFANPNSQFKKLPVNNGQTIYDYSKYWENGGDITGIVGEALLMHRMQETSGIRFRLKCIYDPATGELTKKTGIIDNCAYGSGYPHDHYNPEVTTAPEPEVIYSQWVEPGVEIPFALYPDGTTAGVQKNFVLITGVDSKTYPYVKTDGDYKQVTSRPVKKIIDTGTCLLCVTDDGMTLFAVSYDGTKSVELYHAAHGGISESKISYEKVTLAIQDGDTMVALDLSVGRYRELFKHPYIDFFYNELGYEDGKEFDADAIYFVTSVGMYYDAFMFDLKTGELKRVHYRL